MHECPVCGVKISEDGSEVLLLSGASSIEPISAVYDGETYFFDSEDCKAIFESNPMLFKESSL